MSRLSKGRGSGVDEALNRRPVSTASYGADGADRIRDLISAGAPDRDLSATLLRALRDGPTGATLRLAKDLAVRVLSRDHLDAESGRLLEIILKMVSRSGLRSESLLISERLVGLPGATSSLRRAAARVLLGSGAEGSVPDLIGAPETVEDRLLLVRAHAALGAHERALDVAQGALSDLSGDPQAIAALCASALALRRPELALSALSALPDGKRTGGFRLREADAREMMGDLGGAAEALRPLLEERADNAPLRRRLVGLLLRSGRGEEALLLYREGVRFAGSRLPDDAGSLFRPPGPSGLADPIPGARLDWVSRVTSSPFSPEAAEALLALDMGLLGWIQARPDRIGELVSRVRLSGNAQNFIMDLHLSGQGALIAAAHVGLMYGGPLAMLSAGIRFGFVASMPPIDLPGVSEHLISVSGRGRAAVAREVLDRLRKGEAVAIAIDGAGAPGSRTCEIFGHPFQVSDICARLSARSRLPSVFPIILPGPDGTIEVDLAPLPNLRAGEAEAEFTDRWVRAWSAEIESLLTRHPSGMRGSGGLWNGIPPQICEKKENT